MSAPRSIACLLAALLLAVATLVTQVAPSYGGTVPWPPSESLLVGEVVTGGVTASDEYVEVVNAAASPADLAGLELVYVSASGLTTTRKASWAGSLVLSPGQHLLVANSAGAFAGLGDAVYSGGLAADGGAIVLRHIGGAVVDAVGWGTAANSYVEGGGASAPPARSSIERRPGGTGGNVQDTNDNAADFVVTPDPVPQSMASPVPVPSASPTGSLASATASTTPTSADSPSEPAPSDTASPSAGATPTETTTPTSDVTPTAVPSETSSSPTATVDPGPTDTPVPAPTETTPPTAAPSDAAPSEPVSTEPAASEPAPTGPAIVAIATARDLADGTWVTIEGTLTTKLGAFDDGRGAFVQDSTAGIALVLPSGSVIAAAAGVLLRATGTIGDRYGQRTVFVDPDGLALEGDGLLPEPLGLLTGAAGELLEGLRVAVDATVMEQPDSLADGLGLWLDDGSGRLRAVIGPDAQAGRAIERGSHVVVVGTLGQHLSGTSTGYRIMAMEAGGVVLVEDAAPSPSASASASPSPTASEPLDTPAPESTDTPAPTPTDTPGPSPIETPPPATPSPSLSPTPSSIPTISIADARRLPVKTRVHVAGTVTAAPGMLSSANLIAIQDASGGVFVALPAPLDTIRMDELVGVVGTLAAPYGQLEIRDVQSIEIGPAADAPLPVSLPIAGVGEGSEGRVVSVSGEVTAVGTSGGRISILIGQGEATLRVYANQGAGLRGSDIVRGSTIVATGVVGQRASAVGRADGYRLWIRVADDFQVLAEPVPSPTRTPKASPSKKPATPETIAAAISAPGAYVQIQATVIAARGLLEVGGPTVVVADATGSIAVLLPSTGGVPLLSVGDSVRLTGSVGHWHSGPRVSGDSIVRLGHKSAVQPIAVSSLGAPVEWHLVRLSGRVETVTHLTTRWRAVLRIGAGTVALLAEPGARIGSSGVTKGALVAAIGIVRRSPSDPSVFQLLPRSPADVVITGAAGSAAGRAAGAAGAASGAGAQVSGVATEDVADLPRRLGETVTLSGIVTDVGDEAAILDDGTGTVRLVGDRAPDEISLLEPGDAIEVTGRVVGLAEGEFGLSVEPGTLIELAALRPSPTEGSLALAAWDSPTVDARAQSQLVATTAGGGSIAVVGLLLAVVLAVALVLIQRRGTPVVALSRLRAPALVLPRLRPPALALPRLGAVCRRRSRTVPDPPGDGPEGADRAAHGAEHGL